MQLLMKPLHKQMPGQARAYVAAMDALALVVPLADSEPDNVPAQTTRAAAVSGLRTQRDALVRLVLAIAEQDPRNIYRPRGTA
jgi:hypothetical protein